MTPTPAKIEAADHEGGDGAMPSASLQARATHEPSPDGLGHSVGVPIATSFATVAREMRHFLDNRLEQFSNGRNYLSDNKTNGYHAAKVPDWQLRRWLAALERDAAPELLGALEAFVDSDNGDSIDTRYENARQAIVRARGQ